MQKLTGNDVEAAARAIGTASSEGEAALAALHAKFADNAVNRNEEREAFDEESGDADRPVVQISTDLHIMVPQTIAALATGPCADRNLYQRDGQLARLVRIKEPEIVTIEGKPKVLAEAGTPQIRDVPDSILRERVSASAVFERWDARAKGFVPTNAPGSLIAAIAERAEWPGVRPIVGIAETPILRRDFSIATRPGYDPATCVVLAPSGEFPPIPEEPTQEDARAAFAVLSEAFTDFPFRGDADRALPIAAIVTVLARHAIAGAVPGFAFDAAVKGSGKTLMADVVATIATGRVAATMTFPNDDAELEKVLGAYALRCPTMILFDNISRPLSGAPLDKVLTASDTVELRVLGASTVPTMRWRTVIIVTGNQIEVRGDTTRRVLVSRLEPLEENPENRTTFAHTPLRPWVESERARFVVAGLTILRAWHVAGRPSGGCPTWGSFEGWAGIVPPAIVFAGGADVRACRIDAEGEGDQTKAALRTILNGWARLDPNGDGLFARDLAAKLYPDGSRYADGLDELRDALGSLATVRGGEGPNAAALGVVLRSLRGVVVGGKRLDGTTAHGIIRWSVREVSR